MSSECVSNTEWGDILGPLPADSCCQEQVCLIPCPAEWNPTSPLWVYGTAIGVSIGIMFVVGILTLFLVKGKAENFFVAGRSLPLFVIILTLGSQSLDSNATLGNVDLAYRYQFWDGAVLPLGLGLSLIINGLFIARHINKANCLTLPDLYAKNFGPLVEVLVSLITCISFLCLLAGNLVGLSVILSFITDGALSTGGSVAIGAAVTFLYTCAGGLFSVAYTDVVQAALGFTGLCVGTWWMLANNDNYAPTPSVGFPGYIYPDDATCELYQGVPCENSPDLCCYNEGLYGPGVDNGAWPFGDSKTIPNYMTDSDAFAPFPNAILFNWATIFVLGFGNLAALDFQARCMAAKTPKIATIGNLAAGVMTFVVGIPFGLLAGYSRYYYGPDSPYAEFAANTCSQTVGLPSCAEWLPDDNAFLKLITTQFPAFLGCWILIGIVAASMSTSDGAILAIGTVMSHNVGRKLLHKMGIEPSGNHLIWIVRATMVPATLIAAIIAATYNETGYLLVVAFDISLSGAVAPLFAAIYGKKTVTPGGALAGVLGGVMMRVILEFSLPKDGSLVAPFGSYSIGYADAVPGVPAFIDVPNAASSTSLSTTWDDTTCGAPQLEDWTGLDSLISPVFATICMMLVSFIEIRRGRKTIWTFLPPSWLEPFEEAHGDLSVTKAQASAHDLSASTKTAVLDISAAGEESKEEY